MEKIKFTSMEVIKSIPIYLISNNFVVDNFASIIVFQTFVVRSLHKVREEECRRVIKRLDKRTDKY